MVGPISKNLGAVATPSTTQAQKPTGYPIVNTLASMTKTVGKHSVNGVGFVFSWICLIGMKKTFQKHPPRVINFMLLLLKYIPSSFKWLINLIVEDYKKNPKSYPNSQIKNEELIDLLTNIFNPYFLPASLQILQEEIGGLSENDPKCVCLRTKSWEDYKKKTPELVEFRKNYLVLEKYKEKKDKFLKYLLPYLSLEEHKKERLLQGQLDLPEFFSVLLLDEDPKNLLSDSLLNQNLDKAKHFLACLKTAPKENGESLLGDYPMFKTTVDRLCDILNSKREKEFVKSLLLDGLISIKPVQKRSPHSLIQAH